MNNSMNLSLQFLKSEHPDAHIKIIVVDPERTNGSFHDFGPFAAVNALNGVLEVYAGIWEVTNKGLVHTPVQAKRDEAAHVYVGGNLVKAAIMKGEKVLVLGKVTITLPAKEEEVYVAPGGQVFTNFMLMGEWTRVWMDSEFRGRAVPATSLFHMRDIENKHACIQKLLAGTRIVVYTDLTMAKGKLFEDGQRAAERFTKMMFDLAPSDVIGKELVPNLPTEVLSRYREYLNGFAGKNQAVATGNRFVKVEQAVVQKQLDVSEPVELPVVTEISLDGKLVLISEIPAGLYTAKVDTRPVHVNIALTSCDEESSRDRQLVKTFAMRGLELETVQAF